ncbi:DUF7537 family lipoprotein [Halobacterium wangiae]|uniref:DUF7537 family lipoprotein n=1 Tax=Halobacterium wangiae TaxID=2902623 RepID=UPI001E5AC9D6|nr:hypothetical protein [Halobacterium wangiae]
MRRTIATVAVVALVVLAGCSAGGGGGDGTTTQAAPNGTTASDAGDAIYETPLDGATVAENHESVVADATTFTLVSTSNQSQGNQSVSSESTLRADFDSGAYSSVQQSRGRTVEQFVFGNGSGYQRFEFSTGDVRYTVPQQTANASVIAGGQIASFVDAFEYEYVGTETVDGTDTHVYEASGVSDLNESAPGFSGLDTENVSNLGATLYITEDGLVKQFGYELGLETEGQSASIAVTQQYTDLGETTVEPPAWIGEARANTSDGSATTTSASA